jgi:fructosamine-3-kinase
MQSCSLTELDEMPLEIRRRLIELWPMSESGVSRRLIGGRTNALWHVTDGQRAIVCKLFCDGFASPLFPNDSAAEVLVLSSLAGTNLSPELLGQIKTKLGTVVVYEYVDGSSWTDGAGDVGKALRQLHISEAPPGLRILPSGSDAITRQTVAMLAECNDVKVDALLTKRPTGLVKPEKILRLIHGDVVPSNIIRTEKSLVFIDWQCPALGDPCEDLAMFLSPAMQALYGGHVLSSDEKHAFLAAYGDLKIAARYYELAPFFHWRMAAHCLWKAQRGERDYAQVLELEIAALEQG